MKGRRKKIFETLDENMEIMKNSFNSMPPDDQNNMIQKLGAVVGVGTACVLLSCFYSLMPPLIRIIALPVFVVSGWYLGRKLVRSSWL